MEFNNFKLKDIGTVQTGPFGSQLHKKDYVKKGIPIITVEHLGENQIIHKPDTPNVNDEDYERLQKYTLEKDDIVFSRVGSVDRRALVSEKEDGWLFSGRCLRVRIENKEIANPKYISYIFGTKKFKSYIRSIAVGATMPSINTKILSNIEVSLPNIAVQNYVVGILYNIDKKIWLNERVTANLEELSQTLFKRWFVDFEFPDENGNPYKSSGGEMKKHENESLPSDWVDKKLKNIINISSGKRPKVKNDVKFGNMQYPIIGASKIMGYTDEYLYDEKIIVTGRVGTHGIVQKFNEEVWPSDNSFVITSDYFNFTENILKNIDFKSLNRGSTQPLITQTDLKNLKIFVPEDMEIIKKFENTFEENTNFIFNLNKENIHLRRLRDTLLPKLMSGEIELPEELEV